MQASQIPSKLQLAFAANAGGSYIRTVPVASQIGITPGAASFNDGFPPLDFLNPSAGGSLVDGRDVNGVLKQLSDLLVWYSAGGVMNYDSTLQTAIGGYPKGALLQSAATPLLFWMSTADNNVTNPDTGGAGWVNAYAPPPGTVFALAGSAIPVGYLAVPVTQTLVSTTTYPALFAATAYAWGGSGGSFGLPYLASGYVPVQGTIGVLTHGQLLAHTHSTYSHAGSYSGTSGVSDGQLGGSNTGSTGGADNLAAGMGHQYIVKY
jgi:hypothetical protein